VVTGTGGPVHTVDDFQGISRQPAPYERGRRIVAAHPRHSGPVAPSARDMGTRCWTRACRLTRLVVERGFLGSRVLYWQLPKCCAKPGGRSVPSFGQRWGTPTVRGALSPGGWRCRTTFLLVGFIRPTTHSPLTTIHGFLGRDGTQSAAQAFSDSRRDDYHTCLSRRALQESGIWGIIALGGPVVC